MLEYKSSLGDELVVTEACMSDMGNILKLQKEVYNNLPEKSTYCPLTRAELIESMYQDIAYCVWQDGELVAFSVLILNRKSDRNLAKYIGGIDYSELLTFDAVAVSAKARGHGIQRLLIDIAEKYAISQGIKYIGATVSPENKYSMDNFYQCGFQKEDNVSAYGGLERVVLKKSVQNN